MSDQPHSGYALHSSPPQQMQMQMERELTEHIATLLLVHKHNDRRLSRGQDLHEATALLAFGYILNALLDAVDRRAATITNRHVRWFAQVLARQTCVHETMSMSSKPYQNGKHKFLHSSEE